MQRVRDAGTQAKRAPSGRRVEIRQHRRQETDDESRRDIPQASAHGRRPGGPVHGGGRPRSNGRTWRRDHGGVLPGVAVAEPGVQGRRLLRQGDGRQGQLAFVRQRQRDDRRDGVGRRADRLLPGADALRGGGDQGRPAEAGQRGGVLRGERQLHRPQGRGHHPGQREGPGGQEGGEPRGQRDALQDVAHVAAPGRGRGQDQPLADEPAGRRGGPGARRRGDGVRVRRRAAEDDELRRTADDRQGAGGHRYPRLRRRIGDERLRRAASGSGGQVPAAHRGRQQHVPG